jgi:hypothetical protein
MAVLSLTKFNLTHSLLVSMMTLPSTHVVSRLLTTIPEEVILAVCLEALR